MCVIGQNQAAEEIRFVLDHEHLAHALCDMLAQGSLPLRVTHNDTKLNNIMMDRETHRGIVCDRSGYSHAGAGG